jgi:hypothetical protein
MKRPIFCSRPLIYSIGSSFLCLSGRKLTLMDNNENDQLLIAQRSFGATVNLQRRKAKLAAGDRSKSLEYLSIIGGSAHPALNKEISSLIGKELVDASLSRFSDGEVSIRVNNSIHGKNVFIIQPCVAPVNDNIMELLLCVSTAKRAGANRVTAVIPYFGYKHHRRGM